MARKKPHEEHENHERYLVTYSDLITLLLAFFIILYAMSSVDESKFTAFSDSLSVAFNQSSDAILTLDGTSNKQARTETTDAELQKMKKMKEDGQLEKVKAKVEEMIKEKNLKDKINVKLDKDGLRIILTNEILFESGDATIKPSMYEVLKNIGVLVETLDNPISISGHTDNMPIATVRYPSNWDLSTARAVAVLKEMLKEEPSLDPARFTASGYGEYHPIGDNRTVNGQQQNRRVEILVKRTVTSTDGVSSTDED